MARASKVEPDDRPIEFSTEFNLMKSPPVTVGDGFALPRSFTVKATVDDPRLGPIGVEVEVDVVDDRARTRSVRVSSDRPGGVSSTLLRAVPIRDVVGNGVRQLLMTVEWTATSKDKGHGKMAPVRALDERALATVKRVVGYDPEVGS